MAKAMIDFTYESIPDYTMKALSRYINDKIPTGGFLEAVLSNDLKEACGRADENNQRVLPEIVAFLYNEAPGTCWGSPERVKQWLNRR
jgi:hypothetical protein